MRWRARSRPQIIVHCARHPPSLHRRPHVPTDPITSTHCTVVFPAGISAVAAAIQRQHDNERRRRQRQRTTTTTTTTTNDERQRRQQTNDDGSEVNDIIEGLSEFWRSRTVTTFCILHFAFCHLANDVAAAWNDAMIAMDSW